MDLNTTAAHGMQALRAAVLFAICFEILYACYKNREAEL